MADITKINEVYFGSMSGLMKTGADEVSSFVRSGGTPPTPPALGDRGVFGGGFSVYNIIDYISISTTGDAQDFGDLTLGRFYLAATSNGTTDRGVFGGGQTVSLLDYITISSLGDAQSFGDLTVARARVSATSNGINDRGIFAGGSGDGVNNSID